MADTTRFARIEDYKTRLFDFYTKCRFNALACDDLLHKATRIERLVRWSVLVLVAVAFITSIFHGPVMDIASSVISGLATLLAIYSLIVGSGSRQFDWFELARRFEGHAREMEFFSEEIRRGRVTEPELAEKWRELSDNLEQTVERGRIELREYANQNQAELRGRLEEILRDEKKSE